MTVEILISVLSLLVTAFSESRSLLRDKKRDEQITGVIHLLRIIQALDKIIETGENLVSILAQLPITEDDNKTRYATLRKKSEILTLVNLQIENLRNFSEILDSTVLDIDSKTKITLKDTIEFMIPDKTERVRDVKTGYLKVLTWKLMKGQPSYSKLWWGARSALRCYSESIEIDDELSVLTLSFPTRFRLTDSVEVNESVAYNLKSPRDLRLLLSKSQEHLNSIKEYREQLAALIRRTFTFDDLLKSSKYV